MIKTLFLVPVADNEGSYFPDEMYAALDTRILATFGGLSRRRGVIGAWREGDHIYRDRDFEYTIVIEDWTQIPKFLAVIEDVWRDFRQEAIYYEIANSRLLPGTPVNTPCRKYSIAVFSCRGDRSCADVHDPFGQGPRPIRLGCRGAGLFRELLGGLSRRRRRRPIP